MKKTTPRISTKTADFLTENFKTLNAGTEYTVEAFRVLCDRTLHGLRGKFTDGELKLIIDVFNSTALTADISGRHLTMQCMDGMELDGLDEKWAVDRQTFTCKLQTLTLFEAACLEIWANGFWYGGNINKDLDIEKHIETLTQMRKKIKGVPEMTIKELNVLNECELVARKCEYAATQGKLDTLYRRIERECGPVAREWNNMAKANTDEEEIDALQSSLYAEIDKIEDEINARPPTPSHAD